jgi:hypothetical protein
MKITTGSVPLAQVEIPAQFAAMQASFVSLHNSAGRSCLVRKPTPAQLASIKFSHQLEALVLACTRPLPDSAASRAVRNRKEVAAT